MNRLGLVLVLSLVGGIAAAQPAPKDFGPLADKIVGTSLHVKEGEIVQVVTTPAEIALAEELAVAVRKRGAYAFITLDSETLQKKMVANVPEKYDAQAPKLGLALAKLVDARIVLQGAIDPGVMAPLSAARRAVRAKTTAPVFAMNNKRGVRLVELGNGLAPAAWRATELGITLAELGKLYWDGLATDFAALEAKATAVRATLAAGSELHITHPNGTDLKMKIKGRKVLASDGVLSDADLKAGGPSVMTWLPAGEVYVTPVPGSVEGKLVDDRLVFEGKEITGITAEIKGGKITTLAAKAGGDAFKAIYDAAGAGKAEVSLVDLGINPAVKGSAKLETFIAAGTVTIGIGGNVWAGGSNKEPFSQVFYLTGATVTLDGKPLVEAGALK